MTEAEAVSTPYLIAHFQARKPYRIKGFCSTLRTPDDFGAVSVTERSCVAPIFLKVDRHISDSRILCHFFGPV